MSATVVELYEALKLAGVDPDTARAAAKAVIGSADRDQLATKSDIADLKVTMLETKADILKWGGSLLVAMTGIFAAISKLF